MKNIKQFLFPWVMMSSHNNIRFNISRVFFQFSSLLWFSYRNFSGLLLNDVCCFSRKRNFYIVMHTIIHQMPCHPYINRNEAMQCVLSTKNKTFLLKGVFLIPNSHTFLKPIDVNSPKKETSHSINTLMPMWLTILAQW